MFTHAFMMFGNECLGELQYEATTAAIVMAGLFISFLIEFCVQRAMRWQLTKKTETDSAYLSPKAVEKAEMANITIMEAGIIFHSIRTSVTLLLYTPTNVFSHRYHSCCSRRLLLHHPLHRHHLPPTLRRHRPRYTNRLSGLWSNAPRSGSLSLTLYTASIR